MFKDVQNSTRFNKHGNFLTIFIPDHDPDGQYIFF